MTNTGLKPDADTRFAIQDLISEYGWALDTGNADAFRHCFTQDSKVVEEVFEDPDVWLGPEGAVDMLKHYANAPGFPGRQHHVTQTQYTEFTGSRACLRSFAFVTECHGEPPYTLRFAGYYDDEVVKCDDGEWRFFRRTIRLWDGEVLAAFPGHGDWKPRKRPDSLIKKQ